MFEKMSGIHVKACTEKPLHGIKFDKLHIKSMDNKSLLDHGIEMKVGDLLLVKDQLMANGIYKLVKEKPFALKKKFSNSKKEKMFIVTVEGKGTYVLNKDAKGVSFKSVNSVEELKPYYNRVYTGDDPSEISELQIEEEKPVKIIKPAPTSLSRKEIERPKEVVLEPEIKKIAMVKECKCETCEKIKLLVRKLLQEVEQL